MSVLTAVLLQLMVRLGREVPELPVEVLFSDIEPRVLGTFARSRNLAPPQHLGEAVELLARLGGWLGRTRDPRVRSSVARLHPTRGYDLCLRTA